MFHWKLSTRKESKKNCSRRTVFKRFLLLKQVVLVFFCNQDRLFGTLRSVLEPTAHWVGTSDAICPVRYKFRISACHWKAAHSLNLFQLFLKDSKAIKQTNKDSKANSKASIWCKQFFTEKLSNRSDFQLKFLTDQFLTSCGTKRLSIRILLPLLH